MTYLRLLEGVLRVFMIFYVLPPKNEYLGRRRPRQTRGARPVDTRLQGREPRTPASGLADSPPAPPPATSQAYATSHRLATSPEEGPEESPRARTPASGARVLEGECPRAVRLVSALDAGVQDIRFLEAKHKKS